MLEDRWRGRRGNYGEREVRVDEMWSHRTGDEETVRRGRVVKGGSAIRRREGSIVSRDDCQ